MRTQTGGPLWQTTCTPTSPFTPSSKRRRGFPSETQVKRGYRMVHGEKELMEKLGRKDLCPCGSGRRFKKCCLRRGRI
ncbi:MAG: SEC-C domain-containing protein [Acidobacteria bacterium]|nr:SEC-C domain-containing protein [Acidobacteriota bacterium]